jgi:putative cell wall-binding protein
VTRPRTSTLLWIATASMLLIGTVAPAAAAEADAVLVGSVTGPDGTPLVASDGVEVRVHHPQWNNTFASTKVDTSTGRFELRLPAGSYPVSFRYTGPSGYLSEWWGDTYSSEQRVSVAAAAGAETELDVELARGAVLEGRVTGGGAPLAGVEVSIPLPTGVDLFLNPMPGTIRTAADGTYSSGLTVPGERKVTFAPPVGWKEQTRSGVVLSAGTQRLDVELAKWGSVSGQIMLRDGGTVAPARGQVLIHRLADWGWGWSGWAVWTDDQGRYTVPSLEGVVRLSYSVGGAFEEFWNDGSGDADAEIITVAPGQDITGVDVEVDAWANVAADIRYRASPDAEPEPIDDVNVSLWKLDEASGYYVQEYETRYPWAGRYISPVLRAGTYAVQFTAAPRSGIGSEYYSDARYFYERTDVVVQAGDMIELGEVILEPRYFDVGRIAGADRFATAVAVSQSVIPDGQRAPVVYLTSGMNFPDALSAGPVAIRGGGVVLTTAPDWLPDVVADELERVRPERVVIVGGTGAVSSGVMSAVRSAVGTSTPIDRIGGPTRFETAELLIRDAFDEGSSRTAIIATGWNYPDALAAGPAAGRLGAPVILVDGGAPLDAATRELIRDLGVTDVYIAGGAAAVRASIEEDLKAILGSDRVTRLAGADRFDTAALIGDAIFRGSDIAYVANGWGFADALAGGPLAGAVGAPLYLGQQECLPVSTIVQLLDQQVAGVGLLGGTAVLGRGAEQLTSC